MGLNKSFLLLAILLLIPIASATVTTLGTFTQNSVVDLPQVANATSCNITAVKYPNSSAFVRNVEMTKNGTDFNYTLGSEYTSTIGEYLVNGNCDGTVWVYDFSITPTGTQVSEGEGTLYVIFLVGALFLFAVCMYITWKLPWKNKRDAGGEIISVNDLKYLKLFFVPIDYVLLMWIFGILRSISANYLILSGPALIFQWAFWVMLSFALPLTVVGLWLLFILLINDKKIRRALERGIPF
jgi:hypothetical protein